jgi:hypothetical protein
VIAVTAATVAGYRAQFGFTHLQTMRAINAASATARIKRVGSFIGMTSCASHSAPAVLSLFSLSTSHLFSGGKVRFVGALV